MLIGEQESFKRGRTEKMTGRDPTQDHMKIVVDSARLLRDCDAMLSQ